VLTDDEIQALAETTAAVDCLMPLGGIVAMRPLVIHSSSKSLADIPGCVLHVEYAAAQTIGDELELATALGEPG
jgi:hypothetical protein